MREENTMATKKRHTRLEGISVKELPGLTEEDVRELEALGVGSVKGIMDKMDALDGDLTQVSTASIVISREQSRRIGDAVLACEEVPQGFKDNYEPHTPPPVVPAQPPSSPVPAQPGALRRFFQGLNPFS